MKRILIILLISSCFSCQKNIENENNLKLKNIGKIDSLNLKIKSFENEINNLKRLFKTVETISSGEFQSLENKENEVYGEKYRVEIYLNEIYKTIYISHIEYFGEGGQKISSREKLDFEKLTGTNEEVTNNLEFLKWNNSKYFELKLNEQIYGVNIISPNKFTISEY
ncbi:hypothetical protein [Polaribacter sp. R77954]|uniref:hypothetical protein n=1 Tax=Polaribacter sp. R77954 TaxID=3093870 RepID=UPI0037C801E6